MGWKLVPVEPTPEMLKAYSEGMKNYISAFDSAERQARWGSPKKGRGFELPEWEKAIARYRAMLAASPAPAVVDAGWRPIETAPKDGTEILLFTSHMGDDFCDAFDSVQIGYWDQGNISPGVHPVFHREPGWHLQKIGNPTHWQPLPSAPSQRKQPSNPPTRHRTE